MSNASNVDAMLSRAGGREKEYDWLGAVEVYESGLSLVSGEDFSTLGEVYERLGYAFQRAAMQAEDADEFGDRMRRAAVNYQKACESYERVSGGRMGPRMLRCSAMTAYVGHWLASGVSEKKRLLEECWELTKEGLKASEEPLNQGEYWRTYNQLSGSAIFLFTRESDFKSREKVMGEAVEFGEKAIRFLSGSGDPVELARACARSVVCLGVFGYYFQDLDEREKI